MTNTPQNNQAAPTSDPTAARGTRGSWATLASVRGLFHAASIIIVTVWGFLAWPLPFPGVFTGIGFFIFSVLIWALFLSPRPVLRTDRFGQALVELLLLAAAVAALFDFGLWWLWPLLFGVVGAVVGYLTSTRTR